MEEQERSYIAFISYRHTPLDREAAERVQKKIENYIVPKEFREQVGSRKLGMCFRDEDELPASSSLTDSIYYALDHTNFLIVICTPNLPLSKWCEAEIKYFLKTHDRDHVLAVLADGDPSESFSPYMLHDFDEEGNILRDWEPLAANIAGENHTINNKAFKKEIVRIYAALIGCPFDALWQRERRARTNRLLAAAGAAVAVMAVFLGVVVNRNAKIEEQNAQILAQNSQITEQMDQISEQNTQIEEQNTSLQKQLSEALVDSGINKYNAFDLKGALSDALSATENEDPGIYDHRAEKLLNDTLGSYKNQMIQTSVVYKQSTDITRLSVTDDERHALILDSIGILRCLDLSDFSVVWEVRTGEKESTLYTKNLDDRILYKNKYGVYCHSITDGSLLWSFEHDEYDQNLFQALSEDGMAFAVLSKPGALSINDDLPVTLRFLNTKDGSELGSCVLTAPEGRSFSLSAFEEFEFSASFFHENSRFFVSLPTTKTEDVEFTDPEYYSTLFYTVDLKTFESNLFEHLLSTMDKFYCFYYDPAEDSGFFASLFSTVGGIYSILWTEESGSFSDETELIVKHRVSAPAAFDIVSDDYRTNACNYLEYKGTVYIFSDNQIIIYNRTTNKTRQLYSLSGKIVNAYWLDAEQGLAEVICSDGYFIDYSFGTLDEKIVSSLHGEDIGSMTLKNVCLIRGGFLNNPADGAALIVSEESPGALSLTKRYSDPNGIRMDLRTDDFQNMNGVLCAPGCGSALFIYNDSKDALTFDMKTGSVQKSAHFEDYLWTDNAILLDENTFLCNNNRFFMDGTSEIYAEAANGYYPFYNLCLSDGSILSWNNDISVYNLEQQYKDTLFASGACPLLFPFWQNGKVIPGTDDPKTGLLFYQETYETKPPVFTGENGLAAVYGRPILYDGTSLTIEEDPCFRFLDTHTGTITAMENHYPESGDFKTAFARQKPWMAALYDDGTVCIYDPANQKVSALTKTWATGELCAARFSPDDAYLLILSVNGELDIFDTQTLEPVFQETLFDSQNSRVLTADYTGSGTTLLLTIEGLYSYAFLLDTTTWTITADIGPILAYDSYNDRIIKRSETKGILLSFPVYNLQALKTRAEEVLKE